PLVRGRSSRILSPRSREGASGFECSCMSAQPPYFVPSRPVKDDTGAMVNSVHYTERFLASATSQERRNDRPSKSSFRYTQHVLMHDVIPSAGPEAFHNAEFRSMLSTMRPAAWLN